MRANWTNADGLLGAEAPVPLDVPFTRGQALALGLSLRDLRLLTDAGLLRRVLRGVYAAAQAPDSVLFRATALSLVLPDRAVVTDRAAAWLHGMPLLKRGAHLEAPPLEVCHTTDTRMVRPGIDGHRRGLLKTDVAVVHGVRTTTPLRTALDLGRLLWRYDALAALDAALRIGVPYGAMLAELPRFRGYRGVRQLRALLPIADGHAESPGESALRLHWHDAGLPAPEPQFWLHDDHGAQVFRLDLALPALRLAAEYDGVEHHTSAADRAYDESRRLWIRERGWTLVVLTKEHVYGPRLEATEILRGALVEARRAFPRWAA